MRFNPGPNFIKRFDFLVWIIVNKSNKSPNRFLKKIFRANKQNERGREVHENNINSFFANKFLIGENGALWT